MTSSSNAFTRDEGSDELRIDSMLIKSPRGRISHIGLIARILLFVACLFITFSAVPVYAHGGHDHSDTTTNSVPRAEAKVVQAEILNVFVGDYLDPHNESLIRSTLKKAQDSGITLYIIQLDSDGVAGGDVQALSSLMKHASVATAIWVGPTSASYSSELDDFLRASDVVGAASKSLQTKTQASIVAPSLREFIAQLDNKDIPRLGITLDTGCSIQETKTASEGSVCHGIDVAKNEKFTLSTPVQFQKLSPIANLGHALINPGFAIGILVLGLCLLAFEFYAASVGVASLAGIGAVIAGIYGLGYLPTHWWAVALVGLGIVAMVIDVQAGGVGFYTILGTILLSIGSFFATERGGSYQVSWIATVAVVVMALLFMVGAIPSLIRTRFGTPTIGREDFIGEEGIANGDINPEGNIILRGASWKARTNHATPIRDGEHCKVIKIEGIVLEVEPLVGAAVDYREKRSKKSE